MVCLGQNDLEIRFCPGQITCTPLRFSSFIVPSKQISLRERSDEQKENWKEERAKVHPYIPTTDSVERSSKKGDGGLNEFFQLSV